MELQTVDAVKSCTDREYTLKDHAVQLTGLHKLFQTTMPSSVQHAKTVSRCRPTEPSNPYTLGYQWLNTIADMHVYYM